MPKRIAFDYDDAELRVVTAQCGGNKIQVTDASVIPLAEGDTVSERLKAYVAEHGLAKTEALAAIGRGKAELRELRLPHVPEDELPDLVRFQALRSFASAGERATVDFLVTGDSEETLAVIAAAVSPQHLDEINGLCGQADVIPKRVALRPLSAASLYLRAVQTPQICVLIDLLADEADVVIARAGQVIFVRTVRLPSEAQHRSAAIASELHRTMIACGETSTADRIVVWGSEAVHRADLEAIRETVQCEDIQAVNPFELVPLQVPAEQLPEHVGRLAPLVGLLASDEAAPENLIDFLNPRQKREEKSNPLRRVLMIAGPLAAVFLIGFFAYQRLATWDRKIESTTDEVNMLVSSADAADESIARTEQIDQFLDQDVNWLDELRRFSRKAPPSDQLIVRSITGSANPRGGGGSLRISGAVTEPDVIDALEESLRDETHSVVGKGTQVQDSADAYRWTFNETLVIPGEALRNTRYERMAARPADSGTEQPAAEEPAAEQPAAEQPAAEQPASKEPAAEGSPETAPSSGAPTEKEVSA